jgi:MarR-like DNA-binding transcriptional regulator SgrR of sgrS sRNA
MLALSERHLAETLAGTLVLLNANDSQVLALAHSWAQEIGTTTPDRFVFLVRRGVQLVRMDMAEARDEGRRQALENRP